jgi:hypothetical protein
MSFLLLDISPTDGMSGNLFELLLIMGFFL